MLYAYYVLGVGYSLPNKTKLLDDELGYMKTDRDIQKATEVRNIGY